MAPGLMIITPPDMALETGHSSTVAMRKLPPSKSRTARLSRSRANLCVDSFGHGASSASEADSTGLDVGFALGKGVEGFLRQAEVERQHVLRSDVDPVGDRERAVLGKGAVVEGEDEVAGLVADGLDRVTVALGEEPQIARPE